MQALDFTGQVARLTTYQFRNAENLETTLHRYVWLYNEYFPQKALGHISPLDALKQWHKLQPHLCSKQVLSCPGLDK